MKKEKTLFPTHHLIGDRFESLYQLGLIDQKNASSLYEHALDLFLLPYQTINSILKNMGTYSIKKVLQKNPSYQKKLKAYSEGLNQPIEKVFLFQFCVDSIKSNLKKKIFFF